MIYYRAGTKKAGCLFLIILYSNTKMHLEQNRHSPKSLDSITINQIFWSIDKRFEFDWQIPYKQLTDMFEHDSRLELSKIQEIAQKIKLLHSK